MAKNKTQETTQSVPDFIENVKDIVKREDAYHITALMEEISGYPAKMWGPSIIGFGSYHYKYDSGHEGDAPLIAFSPRSTAIVLYLGNFEDRQALLNEFGKHKTGKGCIYIKRLTDIDPDILRKMIQNAMKSTNPSCS